MEAKLNKDPEVKFKVAYKEILLFSFIGFLVYLSVIVSGYIAYLLDLSSQEFNSVFWGVAIIGILSFAACSYLTCFKRKKR